MTRTLIYELCDFVDAVDSRWYHEYCERDGTDEELLAKAKELGWEDRTKAFVEQLEGYIEACEKSADDTRQQLKKFRKNHEHPKLDVFCLEGGGWIATCPECGFERDATDEEVAVHHTTWPDVHAKQHSSKDSPNG